MWDSDGIPGRIAHCTAVQGHPPHSPPRRTSLDRPDVLDHRPRHYFCCRTLRVHPEAVDSRDSCWPVADLAPIPASIQTLPASARTTPGLPLISWLLLRSSFSILTLPSRYSKLDAPASG